MAIDPASLFTSVKAAYDIAKGINALHTEVERNQAVSKVLEVLLSVQNDALLMKEKHSLFLHEIDDLKKKILEFEKWSEIGRQYELKEIAPGVFVYAYKNTKEATEPPHWLCAKCFNTDKKKSILQRLHHDGHGVHYKCHTCGSEILDHTNPMHYPDPPRGGSGTPWSGL